MAVHAKVIFVVGSPRSGTTLMAQVLGRHSSVLAPAPGETWYFEDIWSRREQFGNLDSLASLRPVAQRILTNFARFDGPEAQAIVDRHIGLEELIALALKHGGGYKGLYSAMTSMMAAGEGKTIFCDDTPRHLFFLDTILEMFSDARVICMIRDPRDFLASYKNMQAIRRLDEKSDERRRITELYHPVQTSLLWLASARLIRKFTTSKVYNNRVRVVRYEDLVTEPSVVLTKLCAFLEIPFEQNLLNVTANNSSFGQTAQPGIFSNSLGRWQDSLSPSEAWWVQRLTHSALKDFGYDSEPILVPLHQLIKTLMSSPFALVRALRANQKKRGPLLGYVFSRAKALVS